MTMLDVRSLAARTPAVGPAEPASAPRVTGTLTLAFAADPAARWMYPDSEQHRRFFPRFAEAFGGAAIAGRTAFVDRDYAGAALWLPPGAHPDEEALMALIEESVARGQRPEVLALFEEMGRRHPAEPHWYLPLIGVEPMRQGRGLGGALLRRALAECDAAGLAAYLESTNPRNRPLYERHGFVAIGEIRVGSCPPITPMLRRPVRGGPGSSRR